MELLLAAALFVVAVVMTVLSWLAIVWEDFDTGAIVIVVKIKTTSGERIELTKQDLLTRLPLTKDNKNRTVIESCKVLDEGYKVHGFFVEGLKGQEDLIYVGNAKGNTESEAFGPRGWANVKSLEVKAVVQGDRSSWPCLYQVGSNGQKTRTWAAEDPGSRRGPCDKGVVKKTVRMRNQKTGEITERIYDDVQPEPVVAPWRRRRHRTYPRRLTSASSTRATSTTWTSHACAR